MAKPTASSKKITPVSTKAPVSTPVRNTAIPKAVAAPARKIEVTQELIAKRAYEISRSGTGGSERDNWFRAERELRAGI